MHTNTYFVLQDESLNVFTDTMLVKFRIYTGVLSLKHQITPSSFMLFHSSNYTVKNIRINPETHIGICKTKHGILKTIQYIFKYRKALHDTEVYHYFHIFVKKYLQNDSYVKQD